jgi:importin-13
MYRRGNYSLSPVYILITCLFSSDITTLVPLLLSNLSQSDMFIPSCNVVIEILSSSSLSGGAGTKILTEPLLFWLEHQGRLIYDSSLECESLPSRTYTPAHAQVP